MEKCNPNEVAVYVRGFGSQIDEIEDFLEQGTVPDADRLRDLQSAIRATSGDIGFQVICHPDDRNMRAIFTLAINQGKRIDQLMQDLYLL